MKLFDVPNNSLIRVNNIIIRFHHLDGMYSYCTTKEGQVVHVFAGEEVEVIPPDVMRVRGVAEYD